MTERTHTILIVDDEPANVHLMERLLAGAGYTSVRSTTDPVEALALYREVGPDLVMLDLHMPVLDGFGVMAELATMVAADDYVPILVLTADVTQTTKQRALESGAMDFVPKPLDTAEVLARVRNLLATRSLHVQLWRHNESLEEKIRDRTTALTDLVRRLQRAQNDLRLAQEETIHSLSLAAEYRDDETSRHIQRMSHYCSVLGAAMGFDEARCETIRLAAKMHDVGKIGVPDAILLKPAKLTSQEFEAMKAHAQIGYEILSGSTSELATTAAAIAWTHHEKVDGSGYPRSLAGDDIPLEGRIAAVADVFDALSTDRVYRNALTMPETLSIMREGRGVHFDGEILDLFFDRMGVILTMKQELDESTALVGGSG